MDKRHLAAFAFLAAATPAQAITFATGQGTDSAGCGAVTSPCRSLRQAVVNAPAGGYVVLQGPGNFGAAPTINKSLSIVGERGAAIINDGRSIGGIYHDVSGAYPLYVSGADDVVVRLRGLTIDGGLGGNEAVRLASGARLEIADCVIRNYDGVGILADLSHDPSTRRRFLSVVDSVVEKSSGAGVVIQPGPSAGASAFIDGLRAQNNRGGVGLVHAGDKVARAVVTNSAATSTGRGFVTYVDTTWGVPASQPPGAGLFVVKSVASGNNSGVSSGLPWQPSDLGPDGLLSVSRSVITGNDAANGGSKLTHSYGNNVIRGNTDDTLGKFSLQPLH